MSRERDKLTNIALSVLNSLGATDLVRNIVIFNLNNLSEDKVIAVLENIKKEVIK